MVRTRHPYLVDDGPIVLAHRGYPGDGALENTMLAFSRAQSVGAQYLEVDVRVTADGEAVLFHDETLLRLFNDPRPVSAVRTKELERLFAESGGLALLRDALEAFPTMKFNIDVKAQEAPELVAQAVARNTERTLVTSFDAKRRERTLDALSTLTPDRPAISPGMREIAGMVARAATPRSPGLATGLERFDAIQIPQQQGRIRVLSPKLIAAAQRAGTAVHVWTINSPHTMVRLVDRGVSGIVTDDAELAVRTLAR